MQHYVITPQLQRLVLLLRRAGDKGITARDIINKIGFLQYNLAIHKLRKLHYDIECQQVK